MQAEYALDGKVLITVLKVKFHALTICLRNESSYVCESLVIS